MEREGVREGMRRNEGAGKRERGGKDRGLEGKEGDGGEQRSRMKMLALVNKTKDSLEKNLRKKKYVLVSFECFFAPKLIRCKKSAELIIVIRYWLIID